MKKLGAGEGEIKLIKLITNHIQPQKIQKTKKCFIPKS